MSKIWPGLSLDSKYIHNGGWTNWNENLFDGGRITTTKQAADLLMVFIGMFFVLMEAGLCSLVTFGIFMYRRRVKEQSRNRDALWHQSQTVLRNSGDFLSIAGKYMSLWNTYGWTSVPIIRRSAPLVIISFLTAGSFLVALPFLTTFVMLHEEGNEVLIKSEHCGLWSTEALDTVERGGQTTEASIRWTTAMQYVDSCYESGGESGLCDNFFVERNLEVKKTMVECPFNETLCLGDDKPAFRMATKDLDTHWDLGLNAAPEDRLKFRRTATCSPLDLSGPRSEYADDTAGLNTFWVYLGAEGQDDETFWSSIVKQSAMPAYALHGYEAYAGIWTPMKELEHDDAFISLVFLNNPGIRFQSECRDPFFKATTPDPDATGYFQADAPLTAIACVEQYEFAHPTTDKWTAPTNITGADHLLEDRVRLNKEQTATITSELELNELQEATLQLLLWSLSNGGSIGDMVATIGVSALRARKDPGTYGWKQNPIPDDQWKHEVSYWFNIGLATLQMQFVQFATGPHDESGLTKGPIEAEALCNSQMIKHPEFENFRRSGFISLAALGGFLIIFPFVFIKAMVYLGRKKRWESLMEWNSYGEMQLLRMANEGAGVDGWIGCDEEIPSHTSAEIARVVDLGSTYEMSTSREATTIQQPPHPRMRYMPLGNMGKKDDMNVSVNSISTRSSSYQADYTMVDLRESMQLGERPSPWTPLERDGLLGDVSLSRG